MGLCSVEAINEDVGVVKQTAKISILNQISKGQKYVIIEIQIGLWRVRVGENNPWQFSQAQSWSVSIVALGIHLMWCMYSVH
jgi:hypothetical protein